MEYTFGSYVREKRLNKGINLRALAKILDIAPAYMCDIENDNRYPPEKEKIEKIAMALSLTKEETDFLFDLAGKTKKNSVSPDLPEYIMNNDNLRIALRLARDNRLGEEEWEKVIRILESEIEEGQKD